ncbi:MAG: hypothetical protein AB7N76_29615 [Planctomycetota bacterium]
MNGILLAFLAVLGALFLNLWVLLTRMLYIASPHYLLVLSGARRPGQARGYRLVGGRALRLPVLEQAYLLDLRPFELVVEVKGARLEATVAASGDELAVERLLGLSAAEREALARCVLEPALRASLRRAEGDPIRAQDALRQDGAERLARLGLRLEAARLEA